MRAQGDMLTAFFAPSTRCSSNHGWMAGRRISEICRKLLIQMVARDGIEPATPAFSGPA